MDFQDLSEEEWLEHRQKETVEFLELQAQLDDKKVAMDVDESARQWLAEHGYDKVMGARPMARTIQEKIKRALAEELLFGKLVNGGEVRVHVKDEDLSFEIVPAIKKLKAKKAPKALPSSSTRPALGCTHRLTQRIRVDLPAPEGPIKPKTSPEPTVRFTPLRAKSPVG